MSHSYRDLIAWQKAKALAVLVYSVTECFPKHEIYGLTAQMRRASVSVMANVAEGQGRMTRGEFLQFLGHARGSLVELQSEADLACALHYLSAERAGELERASEEELRILNGLIDSLRPEKH